jgi:hypothetical protein
MKTLLKFLVFLSLVLFVRPLNSSAAPAGIIITPTIKIEVVADSATSYQWYKNGKLIPGETSRVLVVQKTDIGQYYCVIKNAKGSVKSGVISVLKGRVDLLQI